MLWNIAWKPPIPLPRSKYKCEYESCVNLMLITRTTSVTHWLYAYVFRHPEQLKDLVDGINLTGKSCCLTYYKSCDSWIWHLSSTFVSSSEPRIEHRTLSCNSIVLTIELCVSIFFYADTKAHIEKDVGLILILSLLQHNNMCSWFMYPFTITIFTFINYILILGK